jgi:hypothetical protein
MIRARRHCARSGPVSTVQSSSGMERVLDNRTKHRLYSRILIKSWPVAPGVFQHGRGGLIDPSKAFRLMPVAKPLLLIPVENQVRELDPKLLLACIAALRGYSSIIGSRREMEMLIDQFPRSIHLSKVILHRSTTVAFAGTIPARTSHGWLPISCCHPKTRMRRF